MALYVTYKNGASVEFHLPFKEDNQYLIITDVAYIQADGDELEAILTKFLIPNVYQYGDVVSGYYTIPMVRIAKIMYWYGDIAITILMNL